MSALECCLWLSMIKTISIRNKLELLDKLGSPEAVFAADYSHYPGLTEKKRAALQNKDLLNVYRAMDSCERLGIKILTIYDAQYPKKLINIADTPIVIYVKGRLPKVDDELSIGIVGTRKATEYGIRLAKEFSASLTEADIITVTGLAAGIDSAAAAAAAHSGKVIGVLGTGIDVVYPRGNEKLQNETAEKGALVSEYPPGEKAAAGNFPERNRIISALSSGVLIIEAPKKSGALITAARAAEQGRDVFVVPGNIELKNYEGSNELIRTGAVLVTKPVDILYEYEGRFPGIVEKWRKKTEGRLSQKIIDKEESIEYIDLTEQLEELSENELCVLAAFRDKEMHIDDIIETAKLQAGQVIAALAMLEVRGYVKQSAGKVFEIVVQRR